MIGQQVGNFQIAALLGKGGMGEVYLATHVERGTEVAIKVLLPHVSASGEHVERFFNEAIAVARIQHAGTVKIFDSGTHAGRAYLVMERLRGETLANRLCRGRLPIGSASALVVQITRVLEAVHHAGITHRDLKPDNIFIVPDDELGERVKIVDFGIAKLSGASAGLTATATATLGTPAYMSPEQWRNAKHVDWRADAYSLGCLVFEMIAGRPPFVAETLGEACAFHLTEPPPRLASIARVPAALDDVIARLLAKDPSERPGSMREVGQVFETLRAEAGDGPAALVATAPAVLPKAGQGVTAATVRGDEPRPIPPAPSPPRSRRWIALTITGVAVTAGSLGVALTREAESIPVLAPTLPVPVKAPPVEVTPVPAPPVQPTPAVDHASGGARPDPSPNVASRVRIVTSPPGVDVELTSSGTPIRGKTPFDRQVPPGEYTVVLRGPNRDPYKQRVSVVRGKVVTVEHTFAPAKLLSTEIQNTVTMKLKFQIERECNKLARDPLAPSIKIEVGPDGRARVSSTTRSQRADCIVRQIRELRFPVSQRGGTAQIPFP